MTLLLHDEASTGLALHNFRQTIFFNIYIDSFQRQYSGHIRPELFPCMDSHATSFFTATVQIDACCVDIVEESNYYMSCILL